jgi:hypothetical protein
MGSKFLCIRSTPIEMQSMSENDFECLASSGKTHPAKGQDSYFRRLEELGVLGGDSFTTLLLRQM